MIKSVATAVMSPIKLLDHLLIHFQSPLEYSTVLEFLYSIVNMHIPRIWYLGNYPISLRFSLYLWISGVYFTSSLF